MPRGKFRDSGIVALLPLSPWVTPHTQPEPRSPPRLSVHVMLAYLGVICIAFIALLSGGCVRLSGYVAEYGDTCVGVCLSQCICELQLRASNVGKMPQTARFPLRLPFIEGLLYSRQFKLPMSKLCGTLY